MTSTSTRILLAGAIALVLAAGACEDDTPCDRGQRFEQGVCYPPLGPDAAAPAPDAPPAGPTFGTACTRMDNSECQGAVVDTCGILPGQTTGYCTLRDCDTKPMCASGYTCTNVGVLLGNPALPWVCVKN